jgi:hypothetical protein
MSVDGDDEVLVSAQESLHEPPQCGMDLIDRTPGSAATNMQPTGASYSENQISGSSKVVQGNVAGDVFLTESLAAESQMFKDITAADHATVYINPVFNTPKAVDGEPHHFLLFQEIVAS